MLKVVAGYALSVLRFMPYFRIETDADHTQSN